jgi:hypothetical protein
MHFSGKEGTAIIRRAIFPLGKFIGACGYLFQNIYGETGILLVVRNHKTKFSMAIRQKGILSDNTWNGKKWSRLISTN